MDINPYMNGNAIETSALSKRIHDRQVLDGIGISVGVGRLYALLGPNGAGKTTTTRILTGILHPDSGTVRIFGEPMNDRTAPSLRRRMGMQVDGNAYSTMTVEQNIRFWMDIYDVHDDPMVYARLFGLGDRYHDTISTLSKGNRQKVLIARALAIHPDILFLDEPTSGLDPRSSDELMTMLHELAHGRGLTVFICTHRLQGLDGLIDDVGFIDDGRMLETGRVNDLITRHWPVREYSMHGYGTNEMMGQLTHDDIEREDGNHWRITSSRAPELITMDMIMNGCLISSFTPITHDIHDLYYNIIRKGSDDR